jgi:hypothetical protein
MRGREEEWEEEQVKITCDTLAMISFCNKRGE